MLDDDEPVDHFREHAEHQAMVEESSGRGCAYLGLGAFVGLIGWRPLSDLFREHGVGDHSGWLAFGCIAVAFSLLAWLVFARVPDDLPLTGPGGADGQRAAAIAKLAEEAKPADWVEHLWTLAFGGLACLIGGVYALFARDGTFRPVWAYILAGVGMLALHSFLSRLESRRVARIIAQMQQIASEDEILLVLEERQKRNL